MKYLWRFLGQQTNWTKHILPILLKVFHCREGYGHVLSNLVEINIKHALHHSTQDLMQRSRWCHVVSVQVKYKATFKLDGISISGTCLIFVRGKKHLNSFREEGALLRCVFGCNPRGFLGFSRAGATENKLLAKLIHVPHLGFTQIKMNILWNNNGTRPWVDKVKPKVPLTIKR